MKRLVKVLVVAVLVSFVAACSGGSSSGSSSSSTTSTTFDSIGDLPKVTAPVVDAATGSVVVPTKSIFKTATAGIPLDGIGEAIDENSSMAACEMANNLHEIFDASAQADLTLCYVQETFEASDQSVDIYDGNWHVFTLQFEDETEEGGGPPDHVRMKITKSGDAITGFELYSCASNTKNEYISQTLTVNAGGGYDVDIAGVGTFSDGEGTGSHYVSVDGEMNSSGNFTSKTITTKFKGIWDENENWSEGVFGQGASSYTFSGYQKGDYTGGSYENAVYSEGQLINTATADIGDTALGDGAISANLSNVFGPYTWADLGYSEGWNGDTTEIDAVTAADWITASEAGTIPAATGTTPTIKDTYAGLSIAFTDAPSYVEYDCDGTSEATVTVPANLDSGACQYYSLGREWVNCYDTIQPDGGDVEMGDLAKSYSQAGTCGIEQTSDIESGKVENSYSVDVSSESSIVITFTATSGGCSIDDDGGTDCSICSVGNDGVITIDGCSTPNSSDGDATCNATFTPVSE